MNGPISAGELLYVFFPSFITSCIVLNWENQAVSVLGVGGGGQMPLGTSPLLVQYSRGQRGGWGYEPNLSRTTNLH